MIKLKSIIVILVSSIVISAVLVLTIIGFSLYISWKEKDAASAHAAGIARLNAELYKGLISISDLQAKEGRDSIYKGKYLIEGVVKNTGFRTVSSVTLQVNFLNAAGRAIHAERFKPLGSSSPSSKANLAALSLFVSGKEVPLAPGQSMRFKRILSSQKNKDVISPVRHKRYATNPNEWSGKFDYRVTKVKF